MLIIFEGPDNVGKTTQINLLRNYFANKNKTFILHHSSNYKVPPEKHKELAKKEYLTIFNLNEDIICDRLHGGEYVYGPIYRNYNGDFVFDLESEGYLIVLIDEPKNLIKRDDGKSFSIDLEKKRLEIQRFKEFYEKSNLKKILININGKSIEEVHQIIIDFLDKIWYNYFINN